MKKNRLKDVFEVCRRIMVIVLIICMTFGLLNGYSVYAEINSSDNLVTKDVPDDKDGVGDKNGEDVMTSGTASKTIYFDTVGNGGWNGWDINSNIYIYLIGSSSDVKPMVKSSKKNSLKPNSTGTLWEYTMSEAEISTCTGIIFLNQGSFGSDQTRQTVDTNWAGVSYAADVYPCFQLDGGNSGAKKTVQYLGSLAPKSLAGNTMYFFDMTRNLNSVLAKFSGDGVSTITTNMTGSTETAGLYQAVIPADENNAIYSDVEFYKNADTSLGNSYNFLNEYDAVSNNTLYYGVTEKDNKIYSIWGEKPTDAGSLQGKDIYFDKLYFPVSDGCKIQVGNAEAVSLTAASDDASTFKYTFPADSAATQQTVIKFIGKDGTKYSFLWKDLTKNEVTLAENTAEVTDVYSKSATVYFDASLSKLHYSKNVTPNGSNGAGDYGIPNSQGVIRYYATGTGKPDIEGDMTLVPAYSNQKNKWTDVYKADLPEGYTNIAFSSFDMTSITNYGGHGESTVQLTIPKDLKNPCFYADSSDNVIYDGSTRDGYWGEAYTVRNPESEGTVQNTIVDIPTGTETRNPKKLYVSTTFYDFYTDYELNGKNRDTYTYNANNHRIYQPYRQFDQALSEYYKSNNAASPIYWGNFQNYTGSPFSEIAGDLNLFGYSDKSKFFYENNSMWGRNGAEIAKAGENATIGLVSDTLVDNNLMIKTAGGAVAAPFLNEGFLSGNNAKNTVLGKVYENVSFPFSKEALQSNSDKNATGEVDYWVFDSKDSSTNLRMTRDDATGKYFLKESNAVVKGQTTSGPTALGNFFPFNGVEQSGNAGKLNYGFASKMEVKFRLTEDGTVLTTNNEKVPIEFNFSGDDDVWIFVDGKLALDIGGGHGVVSGYLNFKDLKSYVSRIKNPASSGGFIDGVTNDFTIEGNKTDEHTLTLFYMERGIWESNMYVSFNFPDDNSLEVEKKVDISDVNSDLFGGMFDSSPVFPFTIRNLATHYGTAEVNWGSEKVPVVYNDTFSSDKLSQGSANNIFEKKDTWNGQDGAVHWWAAYSDEGGAHKEKRFGKIAPANGDTIDVSEVKDYLKFQYYFDENTSPALNHMYLELEDNSGNTIGGYLNGKTYVNGYMKSKEWATLTVDLAKLTGSLNFDYSKVKYVKFAYNYEADFYFDDFTFRAKSNTTELSGFDKKQYEIPDYGSAVSGKLEYPKGALYTRKGRDNTTEISRLSEDGTFVLSNGGTALFQNQFRRGSYISLKENVDTDVFETKWTLYENNIPVTSMGNGSTVQNGARTDLSNVPGVEIDDGRTEKYLAGEGEDSQRYENQGYTKSEKPSDNTIVFRSYKTPDISTGTTKIKLTYTNKVKVGSITVKKENAYSTDDLKGEYKFKITFTNIAGMGLENDKVITKEITLKAGESQTITGIPIHTAYRIEELKPEDGSTLAGVTEKDGKEFNLDAQTKVVTGTILATDKTYEFAFKNTEKPVINVELVKLWKDSNGNDLTENIPESITVQLQRRAKGSTGYSAVQVNGQDKIEVKPGYGVWEYRFEGLEQYVDYTVTPVVEWEYRVVELDSLGNVVEDGKFADSYVVTYASEKQADSMKCTITNTYQNTHIKVTKVDAEDSSNKLSGVEFTLEKLANDGKADSTFEKIVKKTNTDGIVTFSDLKDGTYRLTETKAKEGYSLLKEPVTIVVDRSGQSKIDGKECIVDKDTISVTISNRKKFIMPFTGGYGRTIFLIVGLVLIGAAAVTYVFKKKKRKLIF